MLELFQINVFSILKKKFVGRCFITYFKNLFFIIFNCVFGCDQYVHVSAGVTGGQRHLVLLEMAMELHTVVSCPSWVLGTKLGFSARAVCARHR